jgi:Mg/Co/Ni transporter MgtE
VELPADGGAAPVEAHAYHIGVQGGEAASGRPREIISEVSQKERTAIFGSLDVETAAEALHELEPQVQADILEDMTNEKASDILEQMPPDEAADVLGDLPEARAQELIQLMDKEEAEDVQELLEHEVDTAGGIMTTEYLAFTQDLTSRMRSGTAACSA